MTDPTQLAEELTGESSYDTLGKVVAHNDNLGDAAEQWVIVDRPEGVPFSAITNAGDVATSVALVVAAFAELLG